MKTRTVRNFAVAGILLASFCAHAQTTTNTTTEVEQKSNVSQTTNNDGYSISAIDLSAVKLPPNYKGNDPQRVYKVITQEFGPKGEFETTPQYQERMDNERKGPLFGSLTIDGLFACPVDHSNDNGSGKAQTLYDADRQMMGITTYVEVPQQVYLFSDYPKILASLGAEATKRSLVIQHNTAILGSFDRVNNNGVKEKLYSRNEFTYLLTFHNLQNFHIGPGSKLSGISLEFPLKMEQAKEIKNQNLQTLIIYKLVEPYTESEVKSYAPIVLQDPFKGVVEKDTINAQIVEIWFYNATTGEIYYKLRPTTP